MAGVNVLLGLARLSCAKEPQEKDYRGTTDAQQVLPGSGASLPAVRESSREKKMGMKLTWEKGEGGGGRLRIKI